MPWKSNKSTDLPPVEGQALKTSGTFSRNSAWQMRKKTKYMSFWCAMCFFSDENEHRNTHRNVRIYRSEVVKFWTLRRQNFFQRVDVLVVNGLKHLGCKR